MKKYWEKPSLVILFRGNSQEAVLVGCKLTHHGVTGPSGPVSGWSGCSAPAPGATCPSCFESNPS